MSTSPRDMREWMQQVERNLTAATRAPTLIAGAIQAVRDEQAAKDARTPAAPVELTYQTAFYLDPQGRRRSRLLLDFPDVIKAADGTDITADSYQLWGRDETQAITSYVSSAAPGLAAAGTTLPGLARTTAVMAVAGEAKPWQSLAQNVESYFRAENFLPGTVWRFRVRALAKALANPGLWSEEIVVQMLADSTPPPQPTAPVLTIDRGTITAAWDGLSVLGPMPADFKYAILAHGTDSSPTREIARFGRGGGTKILASAYYDPQFFRVRAVDETGNVSPWSEQAVGYTTPLVDTDVILSTIDGAKTYLKNIDARTAILDGTILTQHLVVTEDMTAALANFLHVKAGMLEANEIWADTAWLGVADAKLVRADMFEGKSFTGGTFTGTSFRTDAEEYRGLKWSAAGLKAYSPGGVQTFSLDAGTGKVTTVGRFYSGADTSPFLSIIPAEDSFNGTQLAVLMARDSAAMSGTGSAGMWVVDASSAAPQQLNLRGLNNGGVTVFNDLTVSTITSVPQLTLKSSNDVIIDAGAGNTVNLHSAGAAYAMTSSSPANVYMHSTGQLFKSTSSRRYKQDIRDWSPGYAALDLVPRSWVDRNPTDPADPLHRYYGLIAEEVHAVLPEMATLNDFGEPESVQYERIAGALIPIIKDLHRRITVLEGK
jgi:phage tail protein X